MIFSFGLYYCDHLVGLGVCFFEDMFTGIVAVKAFMHLQLVSGNLYSLGHWFPPLRNYVTPVGVPCWSFHAHNTLHLSPPQAESSLTELRAVVLCGNINDV